MPTQALNAVENKTVEPADGGSWQAEAPFGKELLAEFTLDPSFRNLNHG